MTESKTTYPQLTTIPTDELGKIFVKLKAAMELKYKIMDVLYPHTFMGLDKNPPNEYDMRDLHRENVEKLQKIGELVKGYEP